MTSDTYTAFSGRYDLLPCRRSGRSGILLPVISFGLWHNFGAGDDHRIARHMIRYAFDHGVTHFDLANNYGPPPGSAEQLFGQIMVEDLRPYRNELIISSKAGHEMWPGHYGNNCSRKSLMASIDESLLRTKIEYFDIFYTHRYDGVTPIEETARALADIVKSGKALYAGISKYPPAEAAEIYRLLREYGVPCLISQYRYNMFERAPENSAIPMAAEAGSGFIAFSPLAQGVLTNRYLEGIPADSRAASPTGFLKREQVTEEKISIVKALAPIAAERGQSIAQMALAWVLRDRRVTSVIVGASSTEQLAANIEAGKNTGFTDDELAAIDQALQGGHRHKE